MTTCKQCVKAAEEEIGNLNSGHVDTGHTPNSKPHTNRKVIRKSKRSFTAHLSAVDALIEIENRTVAAVAGVLSSLGEEAKVALPGAQEAQAYAAPAAHDHHRGRRPREVLYREPRREDGEGGAARGLHEQAVHVRKASALGTCRWGGGGSRYGGSGGGGGGGD